ncbi:uncharacterized protein EHS24_000251 [Apiotrichum porosum]|uniref:TAFII55 protein conserved region domain-containing protein n=1 Tax=Apiotrichum porosum TaxID=105984 RepID=A0A427Y9P2_9TREE|nr:uncharacterized protein EHS24_000251 [Apiotrichum porosum]RSH87735.1 hypothetical protein EHS24_000251 [Apiotrichum porosum]
MSDGAYNGFPPSNGDPGPSSAAFSLNSPHVGARAAASSGPTKLKISFKAGEAAGGRHTSFLGEYDRELDEQPDEPLAFEEQFILRVPPHVADGGKGSDGGLRDLVRGKGRGLDGVEFKFLDPRRGVFKIGNTSYATKLVDLPCIVESQKTADSRHLFKVADISQMLIVGDPVTSESAITASPLNVDDYIWQHGITPPMRYARKRRFRKRLSRRTIEVVEEQVEELLKKDEEADECTFDLIDQNPDPDAPDSYYINWTPEDQYYGQWDGTDAGSEAYDDPGTAGADWYEGDGYGEGEEGGEFEEGEEGDGDEDDVLDEDLQAALMEKMEQSDASGSDDDLSGTDEDDDDDDGGASDQEDEDEDEETTEKRAKIKQYTSEIKQLETLIDKKRAGFTGGNPIITKRFEETIKGLQDDVNTKVAARQALLDAIEKDASDARAAKEAEELALAPPVATPAPEGADADADADADAEADDLFDDGEDAEFDATPAVTPMPTPGVTAATPLPEGESPAVADDESDEDDLFGDDLEDDGDVDMPQAPPPAGNDDEDDEEEEEGDVTMEDDEMDEMAALLAAELGNADLGGGAPDDGGVGDGAGEGEGGGVDADALAATAALDEYAHTAEGAGFTGVAAQPPPMPQQVVQFGVEGGVGMRRLASGVVPDDDDDDSSGSDDSD